MSAAQILQLEDDGGIVLDTEQPKPKKKLKFFICFRMDSEPDSCVYSFNGIQNGMPHTEPLEFDSYDEAFDFIHEPDLKQVNAIYDMTDWWNHNLSEGNFYVGVKHIN